MKRLTCFSTGFSSANRLTRLHCLFPGFFCNKRRLLPRCEAVFGGRMLPIQGCAWQLQYSFIWFTVRFVISLVPASFFRTAASWVQVTPRNPSYFHLFWQSTAQRWMSTLIIHNFWTFCAFRGTISEDCWKYNDSKGLETAVQPDGNIILWDSPKSLFSIATKHRFMVVRPKWDSLP